MSSFQEPLYCGHLGDLAKCSFGIERCSHFVGSFTIKKAYLKVIDREVSLFGFHCMCLYSTENVSEIMIVYFLLSQETFDRLCMSQGLSELWTGGSNPVLAENGMLWHYYADATAGFLRYHPYADCGLSEPGQCQTRAYDPRFRPVCL